MHDLFPCAECAYWLGVNPACGACAEARRDTSAFQEKLGRLFRLRERRLDRLRALGRIPKVGLVGCGKAKREGVHAARDLYVGSLFRNALMLSEREHDETYILSARHSVLKPNDRIESYNYSLLDIALPRRDGWGHGVVFHLRTLFPETMLIEFVFFAGGGYVRPILNNANRERGRLAWKFDDPLHGLSLFERMRWLSERCRSDPMHHFTTTERLNGKPH